VGGRGEGGKKTGSTVQAAVALPRCTCVNHVTLEAERHGRKGSERRGVPRRRWPVGLFQESLGGPEWIYVCFLIHERMQGSRGPHGRSRIR